MGFFTKLLGVDSDLIKLLSARILVDEDFRYFVSFQKHHPELKPPEFVRLNLHYYAKVLFNFGSGSSENALSAGVLKNMMQMILDNGIEKDSNIFKYANIDDVATIISSPPDNIPREINAHLFFVDIKQRHITTDIPRNVYAQHMVFSVPALLQTTLNVLNEDYIHFLYLSLLKMNEVYYAGENYSSLQNLAAIPTNAFFSTISIPLFTKNNKPVSQEDHSQLTGESKDDFEEQDVTDSEMTFEKYFSLDPSEEAKADPSQVEELPEEQAEELHEEDQKETPPHLINWVLGLVLLVFFVLLAIGIMESNQTQTISQTAKTNNTNNIVGQHHKIENKIYFPYKFYHVAYPGIDSVSVEKAGYDKKSTNYYAYVKFVFSNNTSELWRFTYDQLRQNNIHPTKASSMKVVIVEFIFNNRNQWKQVKHKVYSSTGEQLLVSKYSRNEPWDNMGSDSLLFDCYEIARQAANMR